MTWRAAYSEAMRVFSAAARRRDARRVIVLIDRGAAAVASLAG